MKKLVLLILSFTLSSQVFAQEISQEYLLNRALEVEKSFLLAVTTSTDGERKIGSRHYAKLGDSTPTFYIKKTGSCKNNPTVCTDELVAEVLASAQRFAADYNALIGKEVVTISGESSWGAIPISLVGDISGGFFGRWNCQRGYSTGSMRQCGIRIKVNNHDHINRNVAHEILNVISIQDTGNPIFKDCITYDSGRATDYSRNYEGLCDIEKRAIVFAFNHLRPRMTKGSIGKAFDKHWQPSEFTYALAEKLKEKAGVHFSLCEQSKTPSCLKEFPSLKDS